MEYRKERNQLISAIKKLVKPRLWPSGYVGKGGNPLKVWFPRDSKGKIVAGKGFKLPRGFVLKEFDGFAENGIAIDGYAGALVVLGYEDVPIEDLFRLRIWAERYFAKLALNGA